MFESLLMDRNAIGCDTNAVAYCVSNAKADPPELDQVLDRLSEIRHEPITISDPIQKDPFFCTCFHRETLREILHLRLHLKWQTRRDDRFIAAITLGALHGESHRSARYLSNRMPRTVSTKPAYSIRWWAKNGYTPPRRNTFEVIRDLIEFRFVSSPAKIRGKVVKSDARRAALALPEYRKKVALVITSPPYLDTTNFEEDQWLRLWFLGGPPKPITKNESDDRHTRVDSYWTFLEESWRGIKPLLRDNANIVIRIGGKKLKYNEITEGILGSLQNGLGENVEMVDKMVSEVIKGQRRSFLPGAEGTRKEYDYHFCLK